MSNLVIRKRRGTVADMSALVADKGEIFIVVDPDITKTTLVVHDGTTPGGIALSRSDHSHSNATTVAPGFMSTTDKSKLDLLSATGGIQSVLANGIAVVARNTANFNTDFTVVDNPGATRTDFAISTAFREEMKSDIVAYIVALE